MCEKNKEIKCDHPELRPVNGKCSKELIKRCHGSMEEHPCKSEEK